MEDVLTGEDRYLSCKAGYNLGAWRLLLLASTSSIIYDE